MITIQDVASLAGVSSATVSRVLNKNYSVSEERRKKVMDAVEALGYHPNIIGRNLSRSENRTILVVSSYIDDEMVRGAYDAAAALGYDLILSYAPGGDEDAFKYYENGLAGGILLINYGGTDEQIREVCRRYPVVQCAEYIDFPEAYHVSIDDCRATRQITEMLIKRGRKRPAFLAPGGGHNVTINFAEQRENGFREAIRQYGLSIPESFIARPAQRGYDGACEVMCRWLDLPEAERPDAVICAQDTLGMACVNTIRRAGLQIPADIAVTGYDNRYAGMCYPKLTTVAQPFAEMGAESVRMLIGLMTGKQDVRHSVYLNHDIILRGSTEEGLE